MDSLRLRVEVFVEDRAMSDIFRALVRRIAQDEGVSVDIRSRCARGGHGAVANELRLFQRAVAADQPGLSGAALLVAGRDADSEGHAAARKQLQSIIEGGAFMGVALGCPDPHVESWLMADALTFKKIVGVSPEPHGRLTPKDLLAKLVEDAGHTPTLGGIEFTDELVNSMNLQRACNADPSFKAFVEELRAELRRLQRSLGSGQE